MSLWIDPRTVTEVLLPDGKWYPVDPPNPKEEHEANFGFDAYEFGYEYYNTGRLKDAPAWSSNTTGFSFHSNGERISGPLSSLVAVKGGEQRKPVDDLTPAQRKALGL